MGSCHRGGDDLRDMAISKVGKDPSAIIVDPLDIENAEDMPIEFQSLMKGDVHVAFVAAPPLHELGTKLKRQLG